MFESGNPSPRNEPSRPTSNLSEISHLFLSSVRERTEGGARPHRRPPGKHDQRPNTSIDLTPEEFAGVFDHEDATRLSAEMDDLPASDAEVDGGRSAKAGSRPSHQTEARAPMSAVLAAHFGSHQLERVRDYARHLAAANKRIGLIEVDATELRLWCFDGHAHTHIENVASVATEPVSFDARHLEEALAEMEWDVEQWLFALPTPRVAEAKAVLRAVPRWVLLGTEDHDGVVSAYRTMKGLFQEIQHEAPAARSYPRVVLSVLDADETAADRTYRKLAGVCEEFLTWHIEHEPARQSRQPRPVAQHLVLAFRASRDRSAGAEQWPVLADFIAGTKHQAHDTSESRQERLVPKLYGAPKAHAPTAPGPVRGVEEKMQMSPLASPSGEPVESVVSAEESRHFSEPLPETPVAQPAMVFPPASSGDDVIDLLGQETTESAIIASVLRHSPQMVNLVECPIVPPMRATAKLAVSREHRLSLIAVAKQGLSDLRSIGQAYRWLVENRALIAMAMPQMAIDAHAMPHLSVLIDQSDTTAELLQPLLSATHVTVRTYRKLRWGGKTGLLLEAA